MSLSSLLALASLAFLPLISAQAEIPVFPTLNSLSMFGTGCPTGGGQGIGAGAVNGTPVFKFPEWNLDLADLDAEPSEGEEEDTEPATSVEKFCIEEMQLGGGPPGYQIRVPKVTVGGIADLEEGSALSVSIETAAGEADVGVGETIVHPADISDGVFEVQVETTSETWSDCIADDGVVPLIRVKTTLSLYREGEEATAGTVGAADKSLDSALSVHFQAIWRECE
ncbi:hypothetical protein jhhlp_001074 [Lomentospora prolificans]|uniref:Uncharacterized protein n=1 Tax=Lomentospora prolificans TaxID=41688 RepID=A0A2N3NHA7_9PEZI|nr:hypothetical protein jhhlp_001074 [Lomentospora prolificans]